ncbi:hypothetical protein ACRQV7_12925 [Caproiciproducens sp. R2]|jgi:hypothetical protein|uniref:hypothetical protein n=1 Tax=Caproiciproducens sp. R2 TaxID=3435187 RepID=UPI004034897D
MPSVVMDFVRKYIGVLDTKTISVMIKDIEREAEYETLDKRIGWLALRDDLKAHYETMLRKSIGGNENENG